MIARLCEIDRDEIFRYIGGERGKCLYIFMDIIKFGLENPEISVWAQRIDGNIKALMMKYRNGFHIYTKQGDIVYNEIVDLVRQLSPTMICGEKSIVLGLSALLPTYDAEYGAVLKLETRISRWNDVGVHKAEREEFRYVAQMLKEDEDYGAAFTVEELELQFRGRQELGLSRSYVMCRDGEVLAHVATGAECEDVATISGLVVRKDCRRHGFATKVLRVLCGVLDSEEKDVYSIVFVEPSMNLHKKLGFSEYSEWGKLLLRDDSN